MKYRKKPVVIEAIKWTGSNLEEVHAFIGDAFAVAEYFNIITSETPYIHFEIKTLEGNMTVSIGDYIIKGIKGEFYPCKPDIFEETYEEIGEDCTLTKKCFKENNNYSMYIKCKATEKEINCDSYYWYAFDFCPCCGGRLVEREGR